MTMNVPTPVWPRAWRGKLRSALEAFYSGQPMPDREIPVIVPLNGSRSTRPTARPAAGGGPGSAAQAVRRRRNEKRTRRERDQERLYERFYGGNPASARPRPARAERSDEALYRVFYGPDERGRERLKINSAGPSVDPAGEDLYRRLFGDDGSTGGGGVDG